MTLNELRELARHAAHRSAPETFSIQSVDAALADEFRRMTKSINEFNRNKYDIFEIIIENADEIVPSRVIDAMGQFAEVRNVAQGEQVYFKKGGVGRNRAKKFLTQVGLSGVYETFRLDSETFTVKTKAIGGAVTIDFERMMDGAENLSEFMAVLTEAQLDAIYAEVQVALMSAAAQMPTKNHVSGTYSSTQMQDLVNTVKAYGGGAVIFASPEFINAMGPDPIGIKDYAGKYSDDDIEAIHKFGMIKIFRGTPVVELRQSFVDENNEQVVINPQYAYVLPTGREKVVKVVMEGSTQIWDEVNRDQSVEINTYRKIGVGILTFNNWGVYQNTGISADNWYNGSLGIGVNKIEG